MVSILRNIYFFKKRTKKRELLLNMNKLPEALEKEILSYIMTCNSQHKYIYNKLSLKYYIDRAKYRYCGPIKIFNKYVCQICDAEKIRYLNLFSYSYQYPY